MCSILAVLDLQTDPASLRRKALELSRCMRHRGPDWSGIYADDHAVLAHERLAIVDLNSGAQPLYSPDGKVVLAVNGEIYNHRELRAELGDYQFQTESDCEVILALYEAHGTDFLDRLNGIFAFALYDSRDGTWLVGRDHIGIIPLYQGRDEHGNLYVASEMKALTPVVKQLWEFAPGHYQRGGGGQPAPEPVKYYQRSWTSYDAVKDVVTDKAALRKGLEDAVVRQLMTDVPYGVLISGGLDSSVISALAQKHASKRVEDDEQTEAWWPKLHSFAIGLEGSPDLANARVVADHLGTIHHELKYTIQEGLDAMRDVIYHVETYDVTTIRASTPMFLMARKIRAMGIKMVLSGEGADELFGGYLYFHKAPSAQEFHEESVDKVLALNLFDCARANKSMAAWGVEARVPFLDKAFVDIAMGQVNPADKMCGDGKMEKHLLREVFGELLPHSVAWRQKEQFSDGVGYGWIDAIRDTAEEEVSDQEMANAAYKFPYNTPTTKEAYRARRIFEEHFPLEDAARCVPGGKSVACSTERALEWDESFKLNADPSGRAVAGVHDEAYAS